MLVAPLHIHAIKHLRPVLRLGSAGTGMEGQNGVAVVVLAGQERSKARFLHAAFQIDIPLLQLRQQAVIVHFRAHLNEREQIIA